MQCRDLVGVWAVQPKTEASPEWRCLGQMRSGPQEMALGLFIGCMKIPYSTASMRYARS